ncbi:MAG: DNA-3-methyladenine glycosylase [Bacteroidota bacterium]
MRPLPRSFYLRPTLQVAHNLLGKHIVRKVGTKLLIGKIVEVEAYCKGDPASHAFHGRTKRNDVMFWEGGHLYVYFTYGMHFCANVVTGKEGIGEAVLIRAIEPLAGIEVMKINRYGSNKSQNLKSLINLTNGPAKFCKAFGIARKENGLNLLNSEITITDGEPIPSKRIKRSSRIGIQQGVEKKWRFFIVGNPWVSKLDKTYKSFQLPF